MPLFETLQSDLKTAMLEKQEQKRDTLRMIIASLKNQRIQLSRELTDADVIKTLVSEKKTRQESIEQYTVGGREDLVAKEKAEIEIIDLYLPKQMNENEILETIEETIDAVGATEMRDMGKVMGILQAKLTGKADMKEVSALVKSKLS